MTAGREPTLAEAVRQRRKELGLTQAEGAELAGVSAKFIIDFERGKRSVRLDKVADYIEVLGLDLRVGPRGVSDQ